MTATKVQCVAPNLTDLPWPVKRAECNWPETRFHERSSTELRLRPRESLRVSSGLRYLKPAIGRSQPVRSWAGWAPPPRRKKKPAQEKPWASLRKGITSVFTVATSRCGRHPPARRGDRG